VRSTELVLDLNQF